VEAGHAPLLQLQDIEKSFSGVRALKPLSFEIAPGETVGLIGENGAGKSTLIKILSGVFAPDAGVILWQGKPCRFTSPHDALEAGIATIHQELAYCGHLTVAENLLLGERWPRHAWGGVNWERLHREAARQLARFNLDISTRRRFSELTPAQKQEVAIARALNRQARLLILDEPTASLSEPEVDRLFAKIKSLHAEKVAVLYVSHRLEEILRITQRVVVLRDGELVGSHQTREMNVSRMIKDMVGRPLEQIYPRTRHKKQEDTRFLARVSESHAVQPALELINLTRRGMFQNVSFTLRAGEIVGLAGLVGAGRSELARAIYGLYSYDTGTMRLNGRPWKPGSPYQALTAGLVYLPEERKRHSLVPDHSVSDSISIGFSDRLTRWGIIRASVEQQQVQAAMKKYDIRARSPLQPVGTLSGGNQQKTVLARWLERKPGVILLDEPTRGVDIGAKSEIHQLVDQLAVRGCAVLLISSDLPEVLGMSDRVLVMQRGTIRTELSDEQITEENVLLAASGLLKDVPASGS
jgi:ABC-type sugar transport system ATPase subunit